MSETDRDEIADIMAEISSLQQGMAEATEDAPVEEAVAVEDAVVEAPVQSPPTLVQPQPQSQPLAAAPLRAEESMKSTEESTLSMVLTGNMTLKLSYAFGGQEVKIQFVDQSLKVELSDGTEFKIPVRTVNKAA